MEPRLLLSAAPLEPGHGAKAAATTKSSGSVAVSPFSTPAAPSAPSLKNAIPLPSQINVKVVSTLSSSQTENLYKVTVDAGTSNLGIGLASSSTYITLPKSVTVLDASGNVLQTGQVAQDSSTGAKVLILKVSGVSKSPGSGVYYIEVSLTSVAVTNTTASTSGPSSAKTTTAQQTNAGPGNQTAPYALQVTKNPVVTQPSAGSTSSVPTVNLNTTPPVVYAVVGSTVRNISPSQPPASSPQPSQAVAVQSASPVLPASGPVASGSQPVALDVNLPAGWSSTVVVAAVAVAPPAPATPAAPLAGSFATLPPQVATGPLPVRSAAPLGGVLAAGDPVPVVDQHEPGRANIVLTVTESFVGDAATPVAQPTPPGPAPIVRSSGARPLRGPGGLPLIATQLARSPRRTTEPAAERAQASGGETETAADLIVLPPTPASTILSEPDRPEPRPQLRQQPTAQRPSRPSAVSGLTIAIALGTGLMLPDFLSGYPLRTRLNSRRAGDKAGRARF